MSKMALELAEKEDGLARIVARAYDLALKGQRTIVSEVKVSPGDVQSLVTEADIKTEKFIVEAIRTRYPGCEIVGEEGTGHDIMLVDEPTFVIDPIDGTLGYANGFDIWGVSVALHVGGVPVVAAIAVDGHVYSTFRSKGFVARDGKRLVRRMPNPKAKPLVNIGGVDWLKDDRRELQEQLWNAGLQPMTLVSCVAEAAYVIEGRLMANVQAGLALWDLAATSLLVTEAGAKACRWDGSPCFPGVWERVKEDPQRFLEKSVYAFDFVYAWPEVADKLLKIVGPHAGIRAR